MLRDRIQSNHGQIPTLEKEGRRSHCMEDKIKRPEPWEPNQTIESILEIDLGKHFQEEG